MCNKTEDLLNRFSQQHHCSDCESSFIEVLDLLAHMKDAHNK